MITRTFVKISTIKANQKHLLNKIKRDKSYNYLLRKNTIFKNKQRLINSELSDLSDLYKTNSFLNEKRSKIKKENDSLKELYNSTKKYHTQNVQNIFFNIINDYKRKNYNVTDSSMKKNIFKQSPLLLKDKDMEYYYLDYKFKKIDDNILQKNKKKHILFLNKQKEALIKTKNFFQEKNFIKNKIQNKESINISNKRNYGIDKCDFKIKKAFSHNNLNINMRSDIFKINNTSSEKEEKICSGSDININMIDKNAKIKKINSNEKDFKDKSKIGENVIKRLNKINKIRNKNINTNLDYSKNTFSLPSLPSLSDIKIINKNKVPLSKDIKVLKRNLNSKINNNIKMNKNEFEANNIGIKNDKEVKNDINPIEFNKNKNPNNVLSNKKASNSESKEKDLELRRKIYQINIKKLKKNSDNKEILKNLLSQKTQARFLEKIQKINILFFSQKELEKIIRYYCREFLGFNDNQIKNILTAKNSDIDMEILNLINTFVRKNNRIRTNRNIKKENNFLSYNIIKDIDNKAFILQKTLIKNQANED